MIAQRLVALACRAPLPPTTILGSKSRTLAAITYTMQVGYRITSVRLFSVAGVRRRRRAGLGTQGPGTKRSPSPAVQSTGKGRSASTHAAHTAVHPPACTAITRIGGHDVSRSADAVQGHQIAVHPLPDGRIGKSMLVPDQSRPTAHLHTDRTIRAHS